MKPYVLNFLNAITDGYGELYAASFKEEKALRDATELIRDLRSEVAAMQGVVEAAIAAEGFLTECARALRIDWDDDVVNMPGEWVGATADNLSLKLKALAEARRT